MKVTAAEFNEITAANHILINSPNNLMKTVIADCCLVLLALIVIVVGARRSVNQNLQGLGEKLDTWRLIRRKLTVLAALMVLYFFTINQASNNQYINNLSTSCFFLLGLFSLIPLLSPIISLLIPTLVPKFLFRFTISASAEEDALWATCTYKFLLSGLVSTILSSAICAWYLVEKHWIANNLLGFAFAVRGIELLQYNNVSTGCNLLGCFLIGVICQVVLGTNTSMKTVQSSFIAPIQLIFPVENKLGTDNVIMFGLGEIVIPGIFIALLLRFDQSLKRETNIYFRATTAAFAFGLLLYFLETNLGQQQPALLYLLPLCLATPVFLAFVKGDMKAMYNYEDHPTVKLDRGFGSQVRDR